MTAKKQNKIRNKVQLVSLHIPKTAGTSFRNILKEVYGSRQVARLDIRRQIELNGKHFTKRRINDSIRVFHGHFNMKELKELFDIDPSIPVITWLRDPAERVISNYYYLEKILRGKMKNNQKDLNLLARMQKTLLEYASHKANRNRISKFMEGAEPADFNFIGLTERYAEDLQELATMLEWKDFTIHQHNITGKKIEVDDETREEIKKLNAEDYTIYHEVLRMREERLKGKS